MKNLILGLAGLGLLSTALAQTATDVNCDGCVQSGDIATNGVRRADIQNFSINTPKLNNFAVTTAKIKPGAVAADKIAAEAVTTEKIRNGAVTVDKVSSELSLAPIVFDGNNGEIGQLISIGENFWSLLAISQSGYIQSISFQDGTLGQGVLVYQSSDCSGTPYALDTFVGHVQIYSDSFGIPNLYYIDKVAAPLENFNSGSLSYEAGCFVQDNIGSTAWPVTINDPSITGISSMSYSPPIRIDRAN